MAEPHDDLTPKQAAAIEQVREMAKPKRKHWRWRIFNRALHRDLGALAFGLTLVYAISGIALHHAGTFERSAGEEKVEVLLSSVNKPNPDLQEVLDELKTRAGIERQPDSVYPESAKDRQAYQDVDQKMEVIWGDGTAAYVDLNNGRTEVKFTEGKSPLHWAIWLHRARGSSSWKYFGDAYGIILIFLAFSGLLMIPGKRLRGRTGFFIFLGIAIPIFFIVLSQYG